MSEENKAVRPEVVSDLNKASTDINFNKKQDAPKTVGTRLMTTPELKNELIQTQAPKQNTYAFPQAGGGYDKTSGVGLNIGKRPVSHLTLRRVSRESGLIAAILARRDFQMNMISKEWKFEGDIGFKIVHKKEHDPDFEVPNDFKDLCDKVTDMVSTPFPAQRVGGIYYPAIERSFKSFCSKYIKDLMVLNRPCVEVKRGRNGMPIAFSMLDGACVMPTHEGVRKLVNPLAKNGEKVGNNLPDRNSNEFRFLMNAIADRYSIENFSENTDYVYVQDGIPVTGYTYRDLMVRPVFESTETALFGYPPSMVENALVLIIGELQAMTYELSYFEFGTMVDTLIGIVGAYGDPHIEEVVQHLKDNHSGVGNAHKTPVLPMKTGDDIKTFNLKSSGNDQRFGELLTTLTGRVCAIFGMNPEEINVVNRAGGSGVQFGSNRSQELHENKEEGMYTNRSEIQECINDIIREIHPDLTFEWRGLNTESEDRKNKIISDELSSGQITIREARVRGGKKPVPDGLKDEDVDVFLNPQWMQMHQASMMAEQQAEMMQQQGDQGQGDDQEPPRDYAVEGDDEYEDADFGEV